MNRKEYLLVCLIEECGEVIQAATKALRFTETDVYKNKTNTERLVTEITDLIAIVTMLDTEIDLTAVGDEKSMINKIDKVETYMDYSREVGTLND